MKDIWEFIIKIPELLALLGFMAGVLVVGFAWFLVEYKTENEIF